MSVFTISDLHLSFCSDKPMDIFGVHWENHADQISENWISNVRDEDVVVMPGDISWAMTLEELLPDILYIEKLPGYKVISKGNHDYWWPTAKKLKEFQQLHNIQTITFLHNSSYNCGINEIEYILCATRGWKCPGDNDFSSDDLKIYNRELQRLETSIKSGMKEQAEIIVFIHYPPFNYRKEESGFTKILEKYKVKKCYYGHLHGKNAHQNALIGKMNDESVTEYQLVSCDYLSFNPLKIL